MTATAKLSYYINLVGVSQREAAERIGIAQGYLSQVLSGQRLPTFRAMMKIRRWTHGMVDYDDWEKTLAGRGHTE